MGSPELCFLILDVKEDLEVIDTTPGWKAQDEWVPFVIPAGMYKAQRALNPFDPDGMWVFVEGTRLGQKEDWLINAEENGVKVRLMEARPAEVETSVTTVTG